MRRERRFVVRKQAACKFFVGRPVNGNWFGRRGTGVHTAPPCERRYGTVKLSGETGANPCKPLLVSCDAPDDDPGGALAAGRRPGHQGRRLGNAGAGGDDDGHLRFHAGHRQAAPAGGQPRRDLAGAFLDLLRGADGGVRPGALAATGGPPAFPDGGDDHGGAGEQPRLGAGADRAVARQPGTGAHLHAAVEFADRGADAARAAVEHRRLGRDSAWPDDPQNAARRRDAGGAWPSAAPVFVGQGQAVAQGHPPGSTVDHSRVRVLRFLGGHRPNKRQRRHRAAHCRALRAAARVLTGVELLRVGAVADGQRHRHGARLLRLAKKIAERHLPLAAFLQRKSHRSAAACAVSPDSTDRRHAASPLPRAPQPGRN